MNTKEIHDLIKLVNRLDLTEFKMRDGEFEVAIRTKHYGKASKGDATTSVPVVAAPIQQVPAQVAAPAPVAAPEAAASAAPTAASPEASKVGADSAADRAISSTASSPNGAGSVTR